MNVGRTTVNVQHRCPNMRHHVDHGMRDLPCPDCYSLIVTAVTVPYRPAARETEVIP